MVSGWSIDCAFPRAFDEETKTWGDEITWDDVIARWKARGPMNEQYVEKLQRGYRTTSFRQGRRDDGRGSPVEALREVEDPEIPISVVGMGLIVSVAYRPEDRTADLQITYTAMGCPAMEFIQEDIREACLADPEVDAVEIEVVWDPVWTKSRIRADAREEMRRLGIVA